MKKTTLMLAMALVATLAYAQSPQEEARPDQVNQILERVRNYYTPVSPTFLSGVYTDGGWKSNWFISAKGGLSVFFGKPIGCGDMSDRTDFMLDVSLGKWITPKIGLRLGYQGLYLKDAELRSTAYQNLHLDLLYNVSSLFRQEYETLYRWDFVPYIGMGLIHNNLTGQKPFAFSYGVTVRYRVSEKLHVEGDLGMTSTWQNFDGLGSTKLGDRLFRAGIGLTYSLGRTGWKKVIDPMPYVMANDQLASASRELADELTALDRKNRQNEQALEEMRKILEIENLMDKYQLAPKDSMPRKPLPRNNYSGLNSLRQRMHKAEWGGEITDYVSLAGDANMGTDSISQISPIEYSAMMNNGKLCVGSPIFFFFELNKDRLTEEAGAADEQTGTQSKNNQLSQMRAEYIAGLLKAFGVNEESIVIEHRGGIDDYDPQEANRNTRVELYFK